jgi:hypothetical protein
MKNRILLMSMVCLLAFAVDVNAQSRQAPPGSSDKNLEDRNVKERSVELEKIARDAKKPKKGADPDTVSAARFEEIREDFENIQNFQTGIVDAYTKGAAVDYVKIAENAAALHKSALRLNGNLFPDAENKKKSKKSVEGGKESADSLPADVKTLIVEMDNTLGTFVNNPMFTNPTVVNAGDNARAKADLGKLIRLGAVLRESAGKEGRQ